MSQERAYSELILKLDEFIRKYYTNQLIRGLIYSVAALSVFFLLTAFAEYFGRLGSIGRGFLFYGYIALAIFIIIRLILIPVLHLARIGKVISYSQAAEIIGKHFSEVKDKLINTLQLQQAASSGSNQGSDLINASIGQRIQELKPLPFSAAIDLKENLRFLKWASIPFLLVAIIWVFFPGALREPSRRIVNYQLAFEPQAPFQFQVLNPNLRSPAQKDFTLDVKIVGEELPEFCYIEMEGAKFRLNKEGKQDFNYTFRNLQRDTEFRLFADGFYSKPYTLQSLPNPVLTNFRVVLDYPAYTGMKDEVITNTGDISIPEGTKATWEFSTLNTDKLNIQFADSLISLARQDKKAFSYSRKLFKDNKYQVTASNQFVVSDPQVEYSIQVKNDAYPAIAVTEQADSMQTSRIYFKGDVEDDYGFTSLKFVYTIRSENGSEDVHSNDVSFNMNQVRSLFFWMYDFSSLELLPGQEVEYWFEVKDNDGVHGPKPARTQKLFFRVPTLSELAKRRDENNESVKNNLEETLNDAKELQKEIDELNQKLLEKKEIGWQEKKKLQDLLQKQEQLSNQVESIKKENKENNAKNEELRKSDENLLKKQEELQKLLDEVLSDEMKEKLKELEKLMENINKDELKQHLEKMEMDAKNLEKELDRSLELFKQLEFEEKLNQTIERLDELQKKQDELSKKAEQKEENPADLKQKQDELNKEFEEIRKEIDDLEKKNSELETPQQMQDTEKLEEQIDNEMKNSSDELQNNKSSKASKSQKSAAQKMEEMSQQMQQMQAQNEEESLEEDVKKLREILENLLQVSFDQEKLNKSLLRTEINNPKYVEINKDQKRLSDDTKMIEDSLFALSKRIAEISSFVNKEIASIHMNMDKAIGHMAERRTPQAAERQQFVMTSINNLTLMLSELSDQMQQQLAQQQQQKEGKGSCNKPGSKSKPGSGKPSMATMKQLQKQLNDQMKEMMDGKGKPGQKGSQSEQLARMAAQQEMIRNAMQKMMNEMIKEGDSGNSGNLRNAINKMEQTETDIVNKNITSETMKRQQEILTRLLEAEKAEREREQDEKRESNENIFDKKRNISVFNEYTRLMKEEAELLKSLPPALKPFYKNMVKDYFNTIN